MGKPRKPAGERRMTIARRFTATCSRALGAEANSAEDQINYSRRFFFNFLPFYHMDSGQLPRQRQTHARLLAGQWSQPNRFNGFKSHWRRPSPAWLLARLSPDPFARAV